jgi:hypothetical protein
MLPALDCGRRADESCDSSAKQEFLDMAKRGLGLASGNEDFHSVSPMCHELETIAKEA